MPFRDLDISISFFDKPLFKILLDTIFTMNEKDLFHQLLVLAGKPLAKIFIIPMSTHAPDRPYFCMHFVQHTIDIYFFITCHQPSPDRMRFTITGEQNSIAAVLDIVAVMMFHPARISHTTGRNDDHGAILKIKLFGLLNCLYKS